ncbi:MAG TPA: pyruvate kinase [Gemmatimonadales bacterium]
MSRTKIVATIGPQTRTPEVVRALANEGMNVARLNGSHGTLPWHADVIELLRRTVPDTPILLDVPGRKIRTGSLAKDVTFAAGDEIRFSTDVEHPAPGSVPLNRDDVHEAVTPGMRILADDGTITLTVTAVRGREIVCRAEVSGVLGSAKGINIPGMRLSDDLFTARDRQLLAFAHEHSVDFVGLSFVESAAHVRAARDLIGGPWPQVLAKIETQRGVDHLNEIVAEADAIMIDRGDLSTDVGVENLGVMQKHILQVARYAGKAAIVATEMLHTMITNHVPTKAEVTDITNAVLDGCSATMLSGETAVGAYPAEAVRMMRSVVASAERHLQSTLDATNVKDRSRVPEVTADAIAMICRLLPVTKIVAVTRQGYAARTIAARQPRQPILAVSNDRQAARSFNLLPGTEGVFVEMAFERASTDHVLIALRELWRRGKLEREDMVLVTALAYPKSGNRMNLLQTHVVGDLIDALNWSH